jgi:Mitochondrial import receptor subunit Tom22
VQSLYTFGKNLTQKTASVGLKAFQLTARYGGKTLWIAGTTTVMVLLPLMMEIEREPMVLELEALQVKNLQEQGYSLQSIAQMGLTLPQEPAVLTSDLSLR